MSRWLRQTTQHGIFALLALWVWSLRNSISDKPEAAPDERVTQFANYRVETYVADDARFTPSLGNIANRRRGRSANDKCSRSFSYIHQEAFQLATSQSVYHRIQVTCIGVSRNIIYQGPKSPSATHDISCPANQSSVHTRYVQSVHVFLSVPWTICKACSIQVSSSSSDQWSRRRIRQSMTFIWRHIAWLEINT